MVRVVITDADYTFDASAKTITLVDPYHELNMGQIYQIKNLETEANIYNSTEVKFPISISGDEITHTYDSEGMEDTDKLQIIVDLELFTHDGHLKVLGYYESMGHLETNGNITVERANGSKSTVGTGPFTIIESDPFIQPVGDTQMYLQSTDAEDNASGDGVQQLTITYFTLAWEKKTVQVIPTGLTQVTISVADIYRIHTVVTNKGHAAQGEITITDLAETILYGGINVNKTTMERCIFYVATGEKTTCTEAFAGSVTSGGVEVRLAVSEEDSEGNIVTRLRLPVEVVSNGLYVNLGISETVLNPSGYRKALLLVVRSATLSVNRRVTGHMKGFNQAI